MAHDHHSQSTAAATTPSASQHQAVYWISGGSCTLGTALTLRLIAEGHRVRAYARDTHLLAALEARVPPAARSRLSCLPGAVEDAERVRRSMAGVQHVIHAAACKRIDACEYSPHEAVQTNITGTAAVAQAVLDTPSVERAILISSDKARAPSTLYGATKLVAERLWLASTRYCGGRRAPFVAICYGNVFGSAGSVITRWALEAKERRRLTVTDPRMTRFHVTLAQAVSEVLGQLHTGPAETLWVPRLPVYCLGDLAAAACAVWGLSQGAVEVVGRQAAEKLHEELVSEEDSPSCIAESDRGFLLRPGTVAQEGGWSYKSCSKLARRLTVEELVKEIREWQRTSSPS